MKTRHRMPTIFSIYMVDVLCCALGCVILLWLINFREARQRTAAARETGKRLDKTQKALDDSQGELSLVRTTLTEARKQDQILRADLKNLNAERDRVQTTLLQARKEFDATRKALERSKKELALLQFRFKDLTEKSTQTQANLEKESAEKKDLMSKLAAAEKKTFTLSRDLTLRTANLKQNTEISSKLQRQLEALNLLARDFKDKLATAEIRLRLVEDDLGKEKKIHLVTEKQLKELLLAREILSKRLALNARDLEKLKKEKNTLVLHNRLLENRFAGISLTGRNVVFMVDMSGSMELLDEDTPDPDKWPLVCETVARIMGSLPDLENYQVILFSDKVRYPFGKAGRWLNFDSGSTPKTVHTGLKAIKPQGETNMAEAFEEAFQFRDQGLDTIYILSDGLPNAGPGLPPGASSLSETKKTEYLSKYVRSRLKFVLNRPTPNQPRVRINAIGYFFESPDVGAFLWALAREHDGSFVGMSK